MVLTKKSYVLIIALTFAFSGCKEEESSPAPAPAADPEPQVQSQQQPTQNQQPVEQQSVNETTDGTVTPQTTNSSTTSQAQQATPPSVKINTHPLDPNLDHSASFTFAGTQGTYDIASYKCQIDENTTEYCTSPKTYSNLASGIHVFRVFALDSEGNVSEVDAFAWVIDMRFNQQASTENSDLNNIKDVHFNTGNNKLYLATPAGIRIEDSSGSYAFTTITSGLADLDVRAVWADGNSVFVASLGGVSASTDNGSNFTNEYTSSGSDRKNTFDIYGDSGGRWFAAKERYLGRWTGSYSQEKTVSAGLGSDRAYAVFVTGDDTVYTGELGGVSKSTDNGVSFTNYPIAGATVYAVFVTGTGDIYAGSNQGLYISTDGGNSFTQKTTSHGLGSDQVNSVYVDGTTVYAGTDSGLSISVDSGQSFINKTTAEGLPSNVINSVIVVSSKVIVGTGSGLGVADQVFALSPSVNDGLPPDADGTVAVSGVSSTKANISWNIASDDATSQANLKYLVFTSTESLNSIEDVFASGRVHGRYENNISSKSLTGLSPGVTNYIYVIVADEDGNKSIYTPASVQMPKISWAQATADGGFTARWYHSAVTYNDKIWIYGGYDPGSFSVKNEVWSTSDGSTWAQHTQGGTDMDRYAQCSFVHKGKMYSIGGRLSDLTISGHVLTTTDGENYTTLTNNSYVKREYHSCVVHNNRIYVIGGMALDAGNAIYLNSVVSSENGQLWTEDTASAEFAKRAFFGAVSFGGKLWLVGGKGNVSGSIVYYKDVWSSEDGSTWTQVTSDWGHGYVYNHSVEVFDNNLIVIGGDVGQKVWSSADGQNFSQVSSGEDNFPGREWHASTIFNDKIYIISGNYYGWKKDVWYGE